MNGAGMLNVRRQLRPGESASGGAWAGWWGATVSGTASRRRTRKLRSWRSDPGRAEVWLDQGAYAL